MVKRGSDSGRRSTLTAAAALQDPQLRRQLLHKLRQHDVSGSVTPSSIIQQYGDWYTAFDGWAVTVGTARRGLGGAASRPGPSSLYQM